MLYKPIKLSSSFRKLLASRLPFKFRANDALRIFLKEPDGQAVSLDDIVSYIKATHHLKRAVIPSNMHYNQFVRQYWKKNPHGSHNQCVKLWKFSPTNPSFKGL